MFGVQAHANCQGCASYEGDSWLVMTMHCKGIPIDKERNYGKFVECNNRSDDLFKGKSGLEVIICF